MSAAADERLLGRAARIATVLGKYGFNEARRDTDPPEARARRLRQALDLAFRTREGFEGHALRQPGG